MRCNKRQAVYGTEGGKRTHCRVCKENGMWNVTHKMCVCCNNTRATYGVSRGKPTHCSVCKLDGMQDVVNKKCMKCNSKQANYGLPGGKGSHCFNCKTDEMQDVVHKMCVGCNKKEPSYGLNGGKPSHCSDCKILGMYDVSRKMCIECNEVRPSFGLPGMKPTHCKKCSSDDMQNLINKRCATEGCDVIITKSEYCASCDTSRKRNTRVRENKLANFLRDNIDIPWTAWNKQLIGSRECGGSKRPDFVWLLPHLAIVTECDENQHDDRCLAGERQRMFDIFNTYGGIHIIYLRFNPDAFKVDGTTRRVSMERRYAELKKALDRELARTVEEVATLPMFRVTYLFYDTPGSYKREMYVPTEAYENAVWNEKPIAKSFK